jgi:hypothetical protein
VYSFFIVSCDIYVLVWSVIGSVLVLRGHEIAPETCRANVVKKEMKNIVYI